MEKRLTRRFITSTINDIPLSNPIRYERYYINDNLRIQRKKDYYEKEILDNNNIIINKMRIDFNEFNDLKLRAYSEIIRDSYLYLEDDRISIKKYYGKYKGFIRIEVEFMSVSEMEEYKKESWMGKEITNTPLAFDKYLSKLTQEDFNKEIKKYI